MNIKYACYQQLIRRLLSVIQYSQNSIMCEIKTFVFLDTETTGLPWEENFKTRITELSMVAVEADHIRLGVFPRVQNKINFCFNPWKLISQTAESLTELSNTLLEHQSKFSDKTVELINGFLSHNPQPVCFVAHNGFGFDFPILQKEILTCGKALDDTVLCVDSLEMFRSIHNKATSVLEDSKVTLSPVDTDEKKGRKNTNPEPIEFQDNFDELLLHAVNDFEKQVPEKVLAWQRQNETTPVKKTVNLEKQVPEKVLDWQMANETSPVKKVDVDVSSKAGKLKVAKLQLNNHRVSFKLCDVYKRLVKKDMLNSHHAEGDVLALIMCAATLGDEFVDWANGNAKKFCDIAPLKPRTQFAHKK